MLEEAKNCEYFLVHYVPSVLRETRVAIGLFLFEESGGLVGHRLTGDWRWVRCLNPRADLDLLEKRLMSALDKTRSFNSERLNLSAIG